MQLYHNSLFSTAFSSLIRFLLVSYSQFVSQAFLIAGDLCHMFGLKCLKRVCRVKWERVELTIYAIKLLIILRIIHADTFDYITTELRDLQLTNEEASVIVTGGSFS